MFGLQNESTTLRESKWDHRHLFAADIHVHKRKNEKIQKKLVQSQNEDEQEMKQRENRKWRRQRNEIHIEIINRFHRSDSIRFLKCVYFVAWTFEQWKRYFI